MIGDIVGEVAFPKLGIVQGSFANDPPRLF